MLVGLEFERPWIEQERLPWRRVSKVVAGGGGGRGTWTRGCRVRLWLVGGGSEVSAFDPRMPRAQCEAIRDRLEAARRAATGAWGSGLRALTRTAATRCGQSPAMNFTPCPLPLRHAATGQRSHGVRHA